MCHVEQISREAIPGAIEKAERYRLLNEPLLAESICLDVLDIQPDNQQAIVTLILALSDQFTSAKSVDLKKARALLPQLQSKYDQAYFAGLIAERRATALLDQGSGRAGFVAYDLFREAMDRYDQAGPLAPDGVDDAILRRNTCVRLIHKHEHVRPTPQDQTELMLE
jgi:hypothetical protein